MLLFSIKFILNEKISFIYPTNNIFQFFINESLKVLALNTINGYGK